MLKRITITIDEDVDSRIRDIQIKMIRESNKSVSFSHIINSILKESLDNEHYIQTSQRYR